MPATNDAPAIPRTAYGATSTDAPLSHPERGQRQRAAVDESGAVACVARSLAATLAAAARRVGDTRPPRLAHVALDSLADIHAGLTAPDYDRHEGMHMVLLLAFEDTCERYGVITPAERTTCATHRGHAAGCCA